MKYTLTDYFYCTLGAHWELARRGREKSQRERKDAKKTKREIKDVNIEGIAILCFTFHSKVNVVAASDAGAEAAAAAPKGEP